MSDPKKWLRSDGRLTEVHTPFTVRSKELMDIYNGLKLKNLTIDERLDILLNTKWTVKEWDCNLTREIWNSSTEKQICSTEEDLNHLLKVLRK